MPPHLRLDENLSYRLSILHFLMGKATNAIYDVEGLTANQWRVLSVLNSFAPMPASTVAKWVTLDKAAISRAVRQLRDLRLADYREHAGDARSVQVVLTARGKLAYARMNARVAKLQARLLAATGKDEQREFFRLFDELEARLRAEIEVETPPKPQRGARAPAASSALRNHRA